MTILQANLELKSHGPSAIDDSAPAVSANDLRDLMEAFNQTAMQLQATHVSLQNQVVRLQRELEEANAALRRSQALAALGEMAAGIAHEVRNPLGSIQLYVQMLAEDLASQPAQAELCAKVHRAVTGLDAVVRDVLAFARETSIEARPTTAQHVLQRALENCESLLHEDLSVVNESDASPITLNADTGLLVQAMSNIIRNAVEAMRESTSTERSLRISATRRKLRCPSGKQEMRVVLSVCDTGPGIPPEVKDRIFNPFFTTRATGTGLGLAIVHRIIDAHGGHISIHHLQPHGTQVDLCLPLKPSRFIHSHIRNGALTDEHNSRC